MIVENNAVPFDKRVWKEATTLKNNGYGVTIISPMDFENLKNYESIGDIDVYRYSLRFSRGTMGGYVFEYLWSLSATFILSFKLFIKWRFQVIHAANPPDMFFAIALFYKIFGVKYVYDQHDLVPELFLSRFKSARYIKKVVIYNILVVLERLNYQTANMVIVTNLSYKKNALQRGGVNRSKIHVVRNGPDMRYFKVVGPRQEWKNGRDYLVAYIGIMAIQDGVDYLLRAFNIIVNHFKCRDVFLVLIGSGDELENLKKLASVLKLESHLLFTGRISDSKAVEILSTADVCVDPDPCNPLNSVSTMNKIMEYMACQSPIVSFNLKEAKYSAREAAIYVKNNSVKELARGIIKVIKDKSMARRMARFGYERVKNQLSWQHQEKKLLGVYDLLYR